MNEYAIITTAGTHTVQDARNYAEMLQAIVDGMLTTTPVGGGVGLTVTFLRAHIVAIVGRQ